jgi:hypothetical protein
VEEAEMDALKVLAKGAEDMVELSTMEVFEAPDFDLSQIDLLADLDPGFIEWEEISITEDD